MMPTVREILSGGDATNTRLDEIFVDTDKSAIRTKCHAVEQREPGADREAVDDDTTNVIPGATSPGAERTRKSRERRKRGGVLIEFEVVGTALDQLIALGWLPANGRGDKAAITTALIELADRALAVGLRQIMISALRRNRRGFG
jgi:hypothetical protein